MCARTTIVENEKLQFKGVAMYEYSVAIYCTYIYPLSITVT